MRVIYRGFRRPPNVRSADLAKKAAAAGARCSRPGWKGKMEEFSQQSLPVFVHPDEAAITAQSALRYLAWLRQELEHLPTWHPLHHEYSQQLRSLSRTRPPGPRGVASSGE
jgi:hypothetical protein